MKKPGSLIKELAKKQVKPDESKRFSYSKPVVKPQADSMQMPRRAREMRSSKPKAGAETMVSDMKQGKK